MKWSNLLNYLTRSDLSETLDDTGLVSYYVNDGFTIRIKSDRDDEWYTATYFQICRDIEEPDVLVVQLEGLSDNPFCAKFSGHTDYPVQIYQQIDC